MPQFGGRQVLRDAYFQREERDGNGEDGVGERSYPLDVDSVQRSHWQGSSFFSVLSP